MRITYIGAHDSVLVVALGCHVARGETVDAPDELAAQLLAQGSYPEHIGANGETVPAGPGTEWEEVRPHFANPSPTSPDHARSRRGSLDASPPSDTPDAA